MKKVILICALSFLSTQAFAALTLPRALSSGYKIIASGGEGGAYGNWVIIQKGNDFRRCDVIYIEHHKASECKPLK